MGGGPLQRCLTPYIFRFVFLVVLTSWRGVVWAGRPEMARYYTIETTAPITGLTLLFKNIYARATFPKPPPTHTHHRPPAPAPMASAEGSIAYSGVIRLGLNALLRVMAPIAESTMLSSPPPHRRNNRAAYLYTRWKCPASLNIRAAPCLPILTTAPAMPRKRCVAED